MNQCLGCGAPAKRLFCSPRCANRFNAPAHRRPLAERFWEKVAKTPTCWLWTGSTSNGYGYLQDSPRKRKATHIAWELINGPLPEGIHVLHHCDNPPCVNAEDTDNHLFLGTHADNMRDMAVKGRTASGDRNSSRLRPEAVPRGSAHYKTHLDEDQVRAIRRLYTTGNTSYNLLGRRFGVDGFTIRAIIKRRSWRHI